MAEESAKTSAEMTQPVIIDLGKQKRSAMKNLKKGEGKLWDEVFDVVEEVKDMLGSEADGKVFVPVVMLYKERFNRRRNLERILFPLLEEDDDDEDDDDDDDNEDDDDDEE